MVMFFLFQKLFLYLVNVTARKYDFIYDVFILHAQINMLGVCKVPNVDFF